MNKKHAAFQTVLNSRILRFAERRAGFFWIFGVAAVCHLLFSHLGFQPADEGFFLAASRRIFVEGQFPYSDFTWVKAPLSPVLHAPALLFGDYTFYFSRFMFWLQNAAIAWFSVSAIARGNFLRPHLPVSAVCLIASVALFLNVNNFMTVQWYTYDAIFFLSIGLYLLSRHGTEGGSYFAAYAVIGLSYLCHHSFAIAVAGFLFLLGGWRKPANLLGAALPGLIFIVVLAVFGAFGNAVESLAHFGSKHEIKMGEMLFGGKSPDSSLMKTALGFFGQTGFFVAGLVCAAAVYLFGRGKPFQILFVSFLVFCAFWAPAHLMSKHFVGPFFLWHFSFVLHGICLALSIAFLGAGDFRLSGFFAVLTVAAFIASLSYGLSGPLRVSGVMAGAILVLMFRGTNLRFFLSLMIPAVLLVFTAFYGWRTNHIDREPPKTELRFPLGNALGGAGLIKTNANFQAVVVELGEIVRQIRAAGSSYAVVPYLPSWWVKSEQANPLPVDWPNFLEVGGTISQRFVDRYRDSLLELRGRSFVIVHKFNAGKLKYGFIPDSAIYHFEYGVSEFVRRNFTKVGETRFFEIYR